MKILIAIFSSIFIINFPNQATSTTLEESYKNCLKSSVAGTSNLSADDIRSLCKEASGTNELPLVNSKGWRLMIDANGNKAYVSPNGKDYEEVLNYDKGVEAFLKEKVDSPDTVEDVKMFAVELLKKYYKTQKVGRFWVKEE